MARHVDIKHALEVWRYNGRLAHQDRGQDAALSGSLVPASAIRRILDREPMGVVGAIIAWNFSLPAGRLEMRACAGGGLHGGVEAGGRDSVDGAAPGRVGPGGRISQGRAQRRDGMGPTAGAALAAHPGVDKVTFTGSTEVVASSCRRRPAI